MKVLCRPQLDFSLLIEGVVFGNGALVQKNLQHWQQTGFLGGYPEDPFYQPLNQLKLDPKTGSFTQIYQMYRWTPQLFVEFIQIDLIHVYNQKATILGLILAVSPPYSLPDLPLSLYSPYNFLFPVSPSIYNYPISLFYQDLSVISSPLLYS